MSNLNDALSMVNPELAKYANMAVGEAEKEEIKMQNNKVNLIVTGKTGTGKSTLINTCLRKELAKTGIGRPVTQNSEWLEDTEGEMPLRLYDTVGLELTENTKNSTMRDIKNCISSGTPYDVHCVWYCVSGTSDRFEDAEERFISSISNMGVPVILVITKSYMKKTARRLRDIIIGNGTNAKKVMIVLAEDAIDEDVNCEAYGKDELMDATRELLPEPLKKSWVNACSSWKLKGEEAAAIICKTLPLVVGAAVVPIPVADAAMLVPIQFTMLAQITSLYGIPLSKKQMIGIAGPMLGVTATTLAGKTIVSSLLKMVPGVGSVAGAVISSGTAVILTYALGKTYTIIMEKVSKGEINIDMLDNKMIKQLMQVNLDDAAKFVSLVGGIDNFNANSLNKFDEIAFDNMGEFSSFEFNGTGFDDQGLNRGMNIKGGNSFLENVASSGMNIVEGNPFLKNIVGSIFKR